MTIDGNSLYIADGSTSILARYTQENNRVFYKETSGRCVRVCAYPSNTGYSGCILLSTNPDDVAYYLMVPNKLLFTGHHPAIIVDGTSWYVSPFAGWCAGNNCRNIDGYPEMDITKYPTFSTYGSGSQSPTPQFLTELELFVREVLTAGNIRIVYNTHGGGATHIAKRTGQLKDLSSYTSDILMVSGGGGGGYLVGETAYDGADAGGISGSGSNSGNQSTGYAFGQGESGTNKSGGGGGYYGGYKSNA